jgi:hypothetical protein
VHGFADFVVAAEAERNIGNAAGDLGVGQVLFNPSGRVDEVQSVVVVLRHAGGDGENIWIEDDVFGSKTDFGQDFVCALADADLVFVGCGLALLVKGHNDGGCAVL